MILSYSFCHVKVAWMLRKLRQPCFQRPSLSLGRSNGKIRDPGNKETTAIKDEVNVLHPKQYLVKRATTRQ